MAASTENEIKAEKRIEEITKDGETLARCKDIIKIEREELDVIRRKLKKKKATDLQGWRYEYTKYRGEDLINSMIAMMNEVMMSRTIPKEWRDVKIKSTYKKKGNKQHLTNQRGLHGKKSENFR